MSKKSFFIFYMFFALSTILVAEVFYLKNSSEDFAKEKNKFVKITSLPDLAISTEATYIRHRSLADMFSIYKDDGSLREYFPSSYTYSPSGVQNAR